MKKLAALFDLDQFQQLMGFLNFVKKSRVHFILVIINDHLFFVYSGCEDV